jgi:DNA-binding LytR/AlgR family response regulator
MVNLTQVRRIETEEGGRGRLFLGTQEQPLMLGRAALRRLKDPLA